MLFQILGFIALAGLSLTGGAAPDRVRLVDDRREPLATPVEACFQIDLRQDCIQVAPRSDLILSPGFHSLKVEGNDYGPVLLSDIEVQGRIAGALPIQAPRKAALQVRHRDNAPVTLSLYLLDEPDLRRPLHRLDVRQKGPVKIPAGEFLVSLSQPASAPNLRLASFAPGSRNQLDFKSRPGWSLVLRVTDSESHKPLSGASLNLRGVTGYSRASSPPAAAETDRHGIVLLSGLTDAMMQATVRHRGYVDQEVRGLLASPGSFAYHAVGLEVGGRVRTVIRLEGQPVAGAKCEVVRYARRPVGKSPPPEIFFQGFSDAGGVCVSQPLATGRYVSRVSVPARTAHAEKSTEVTVGQETSVDFDLSPIRLHGTVQVGSQPAQGFHVEVYSNDAAIPNRTAKDATTLGTTDEAGEYEASVWSAGSYSLIVTTPQGTPATAKRVDLSAAEETADFQLDGGRISGIVVDDAGKPLEGAAVLLRGEGPSGRYTRVALSSAEGTFYFQMEAAGSVVLESHREGYRPSEPLPVEFVSAANVGPVTLAMRKERTLRGVVIGAAGAPVGQAWIASYAPLMGEFPRQIATALTQADGSFELQVSESGITQLFVSGPGCPLTAVNIADPDREARVLCAEVPAALGLVVKDRSGRPITQANLILRKSGSVFPREALATHLGLLQLPAETDSSGRLVVAGLAPGDYDVFLATSTSEGLAGLGTSHGYLGSFSLAPLRLTEVDVQVDWTEPLVESAPR